MEKGKDERLMRSVTEAMNDTKVWLGYTKKLGWIMYTGVAISFIGVFTEGFQLTILGFSAAMGSYIAHMHYHAKLSTAFGYLDGVFASIDTYRATGKLPINIEEHGN